jgi:TPR repeat protein
VPAGVRHAQEGIAGMAGCFNSIAAAALALAMGFQSLAAEREASEMRRMASQAYDAGDIDTAVAAFGDCARAGEAACHSALGYLFLVGEGVDQDDEQAFDLFRRAAEQGNAYGEFSLGTMYRHGVGVERDFGKARQLFLRAIDGGHAAAHAELGEMHAAGEGVPVDRGLAIYHLIKAGSTGIPLAMFRAAYLARGRDGDAERLPELALELFVAAAEMGFPPAMLAAGGMRRGGEGAPADEIEALKWYLLAAEHRDGDPELRAFARDGARHLDASLPAAAREEARARAEAWMQAAR